MACTVSVWLGEDLKLTEETFPATTELQSNWNRAQNKNPVFMVKNRALIETNAMSHKAGNSMPQDGRKSWQCVGLMPGQEAFQQASRPEVCGGRTVLLLF